MTVRDRILPKFQKARAKIAALGLRGFVVVLRRRRWSGSRIGEGVPTNLDMVITPAPRVRFLSPFAQQMTGVLTSGGSVRDRYYQVDKITPAFVDHLVAGGYHPKDLRLRVGPDLRNVESVAVLVGEDGMARECSQVVFEDDRNFGYRMILQELDKASTSLVAIAIAPLASLPVGQSVSAKAVGTFNDGASYDITSLVKWTMPAGPVARVDVLGLVTGLQAGSTALGASLGGIAAPGASVTVL